MTLDKEQTRKVLYIALGIIVPLGALLVLRGTLFGSTSRRRDEIDRAHDITVEDSFPASDPPSAW